MIFVTIPAMFVALIPIIVIEYYTYYRLLKPKPDNILTSTTLANIVSTIVGIPLSWYFLFVTRPIFNDSGCGPGINSLKDSILTIFIEASALCPWNTVKYFIVLFAFIINIVIACVISIFVEFIILKIYYKKS